MKATRKLSDLLQVHCASEFPVECWSNGLSINSKSIRKTLLQDCAAAATARAQLTQGDYSHGKTFWVGALEKPNTTLELFALDIFHSHLKRQALRWSKVIPRKEDPKPWTLHDVDMARSGAEWWTLLMDGEDGGVGWHWDKDYHAELEENINIHPLLGTASCSA